MSSEVVERCAGLLRQLGADADPFRQVWAALDDSQRRLLLRVANLPYFMANEQWDALSAASRGQIKTRAAHLQSWLNKALGVPA